VKTATKLSVTATVAVVLLVLAGCKTTAPEKNATVELFNGTNLDGWTFCMKNNSDPANTWSVRDGVIHCTGQPYGYARTLQTYHDYKLTCIWRFVKVAPHADNSGIFVHIQSPDKVWPECVECQGLFHRQGDLILQPGAGADGYPAGKKAIFVNQMGPPNENPPGEWGTNEIICNGGAIGLFVNGKVMNQISGCTITSGYIGIQAEGGDIEVRKLTLESLQ
jgi:Domain of Unknown Function (DUF1080)